MEKEATGTSPLPATDKRLPQRNRYDPLNGIGFSGGPEGRALRTDKHGTVKMP
jgi:hypothetical protein